MVVHWETLYTPIDVGRWIFLTWIVYVKSLKNK
jgi:hypothetical protein